MDESEFRSRIVEYSRLSSQDSLYPGNDYALLANFLQLSRYPSTNKSTGNAADADGKEVFSVHYTLDGENKPKPEMFPICNLNDFKQSRKAHARAQILFLRGYPSQEWLVAAALQYQIDPILFQLHLQFQSIDASGGRDHFTLPPLPSISSNVVQLPLTTICSKDTITPSARPENIESLRRDTAIALQRYHSSFKQSAQPADSMVRRYSILSKQRSVLEQCISIGIIKNEGSWSAILCMDNGRALNKGPSGPWQPPPQAKPWDTYLYPIIQHRPYIALRAVAEPNQPAQSTVKNWEACQNASKLPFDFGLSLEPEIMASDALYALQDVFRLSAASEGQFLNVLQSQIDHEISTTSSDNAPLLNLRHLKRLVDDHMLKLKATSTFLRDRHSIGWPRAQEPAHRIEADHVAALLLSDFNYLHERARSLSGSCQQGLQALVNNATFKESVKAVANAERVEKLTVLATIFLPLNFTCAVFGMNFSVFGQGHVSIWVYFPVAFAVVMIALSFWYVRMPRFIRKQKVI